MKPTLNRTEEEKAGFFKKSTVYYLDVNLEVTPEEMALIKKHKWEKMQFCVGTFLADSVIECKLSWLLGKPYRFGFKSVEELADVEEQVIENAKQLKQQLGAAAGFTSGGPREVEL